MTAKDLKVKSLGEPRFDSPIQDLIDSRGADRHLSPEVDTLLFYDTPRAVSHAYRQTHDLPAFELAGPRRRIYFDPATARAGIVTCGGLCPGLNDVIRGLTMVLNYRYGVEQVEGFRFGYEGLNPACGHEPMPLSHDIVDAIHQQGGTILGSSRGPQDPKVMVDYLQDRGINMLFTIGGDGTQRGANDISEEALRRGYDLAVIGVPKTIDNDIKYVEQSFGFQTAFTNAVESILVAHNEAKAARNGIGLVKLMGRHSGFIAAYASIACPDANYALIPEVDFPLEGDDGFLEHLRHRLDHRQHAVIVVAEGAGQQYVQTEGADQSGNQKLGDIGLFLKSRITEHMTQHNRPCNIKYIDPSYIIRGVPATPHDSVYCFRLAAAAVHAAMAGYTEMIIGRWHGRYVHLPIDLAVAQRQTIDPNGDLWMAVLESTGQPRWTSAS